MKLLARIVLALTCLIVMAADAKFDPGDIWSNPSGRATELQIPLRGGIVLFDKKRQVNETQWVQFDLNPNDYYTQYGASGGHIFVLMDAVFDWPDSSPVPYAGRGVIFLQNEVAFENFATQELVGRVPFKFTPNDPTPYTIAVHASVGYVAVFVFQPQGFFQIPTLIFYTSAAMPDTLQAKNISNIAVGAVGEGIPTHLSISNIRQGRFK